MASKISESISDIVEEHKSGVFDKTEFKEAIYIKLDSNVLKWFRSQGSGYQTRINEVLRRFVLEVDHQGCEQNNLKNDRLFLAQELYEKYYAQCFWHMKPNLIITEGLIAGIVEGLKKYGGREGFMEAQKLCQ